jgi:hypothetical protein
MSLGDQFSDSKGFIIAVREDDKASRPALVMLCRNAAGTDRVERNQPSGARHAAGLRFAWSNPGAVVFVVSADGPVTCALRVANDVLTWSVRLPET